MYSVARSRVVRELNVESDGKRGQAVDGRTLAHVCKSSMYTACERVTIYPSSY